MHDNDMHWAEFPCDS